jgi:ATP-dependent Lon protease
MSDCGLMLLGNIKLDRHLRPKNSDYFLNLPSFFHSSALIDRIHGFIEGWELFRFNEDLKVKGIALNTEYFCLGHLPTIPILLTNVLIFHRVPIPAIRKL